MNRTRFTLIAIAAVAAAAIWWSQPHKTSGKTIAVVTLMSHPALDALKSAALNELEAQGYAKGDINLIERNANGQVTEAATIARSLAADKPDLVIAITTPVAQATVAANLQCPIVFSAVTDPVGAKLVASTTTGAGNGMVTGASDAWPYQEQLKLMQAITPNAKRVGVLYNPGEAASQYGIKEIRKYAVALGFTLVEGAVTSTNDVRSVAETIVGQVDALFLSSDNTVIGGMNGALKLAIERKIPLYVGDSGTVEKGGLAAVSVGYTQLGKETGALAVRLLRGERDVKVYVGQGNEIYVNAAAAAQMGVQLPDTVKQRATKIYDTIKE
jgi:putative ABC transport system substrate-binding protein